MKMGRLHYRSLERAKVKNLKASRGNFDKTMVLDEQSKLDILWWWDNIMNSQSPIIQGNPTTNIYTVNWGNFGGFSNSFKHIFLKKLLRTNFSLLKNRDMLLD